MKIFLRLALITLLWAPVFVAVGRFASGGPSDFAGFEMGAKGTAVLWTFDSPSLGIPASPTGELNLAFSESNLRSGPAAYAIGSIAWPGQVAAGVPSFVQSEIESNSGEEFPFDVPNYPVRAESFHPQGPPSASSDVGSMSMRSSARETLADASSYLNAFGFPGIGGAGTQSSIVSSGFEPDGVVSLAEASVNDISLLGGLIRIDSVVSRAAARSDGERGTVAGTTTVAGAEVAGTAVVIDSSGVRVAEQSVGSAAAQQALNQVLSQVGVTMELAEPVDTVSGPQAQRSLGGLLVRINSSTVEALVSALPAPIQDEIRSQISFDQDMTVQFAPAAVAAVAAMGFDFAPDAPVADVGDVGGPSLAPDAPVSPAGETGPSAPPPGAPAEVGGSPIAVTPVQTTFSGVPVWLVVLLMLAALVSSRPLTAAADRLLAARAGAACPYQEA